MSGVEKDLGVKVKIAFAQFRVGQIIFPPGTYRSDLLRRNMVEVIKPATAPEQKRKLIREQ